MKSVITKESILKRVLVDASGCLLWTGPCTRHGYGQVWMYGKHQAIHRLFWETMNNATIPDGMVIDHLCRTRNCVNIHHMEVVTPAENTLRGNSYAAQNKRKTHCKRGHEFTEANTRLNGKGHRWCRKCTHDYDKARRSLLKED